MGSWGQALGGLGAGSKVLDWFNQKKAMETQQQYGEAMHQRDMQERMMQMAISGVLMPEMMLEKKTEAQRGIEEMRAGLHETALANAEAARTRNRMAEIEATGKEHRLTGKEEREWDVLNPDAQELYWKSKLREEEEANKVTQPIVELYNQYSKDMPLEVQAVMSKDLEEINSGVRGVAGMGDFGMTQQYAGDVVRSYTTRWKVMNKFGTAQNTFANSGQLDPELYEEFKKATFAAKDPNAQAFLADMKASSPGFYSAAEARLASEGPQQQIGGEIRTVGDVIEKTPEIISSGAVTGLRNIPSLTGVTSTREPSDIFRRTPGR